MSDVQLIEKPTNYNGKIDLIQSILQDVNKRKQIHYKHYRRYKKASSIFKASVNSLNAVSVCSIIISLSPILPVATIIALSTASTSGVIHALYTSLDIESKIYSHNTSNLQYNDLFRDISARLLRNGMSSTDLDGLLTEINTRISLIEDSSLPIKIKNQ